MTGAARDRSNEWRRCAHHSLEAFEKANRRYPLPLHSGAILLVKVPFAMKNDV
jgi:hypothetical protein